MPHLWGLLPYLSLPSTSKIYIPSTLLASLDAPFRVKETLDAILAMPSQSTLGPEGFGPSFYKARIWRIYQGSEDTWYNLLKAKYMPENNFFL